MSELSVVMLVAGKGTRLAPYTDETPKCLLDVHGKTLLERIIDGLSPLLDGWDVDFIFLTNHLEEQICSFASKNLTDFVVATNVPLDDQVAAVKMAQGNVTGAMILYYGDTIIFPKAKRLPNHDFVFVDHVEDVSQYGFVTQTGKIVEKKAYGSGDIMVGGCFFMNGPKFFDSLKDVSSEYISDHMQFNHRLRCSHHISVDTLEDLVMANKYYEELEK